MKNSKHLFQLRKLKWVYFLSISVIIGSVMAFGLVAFFAFGMNHENAVSMLGMIIPTSFIMWYALRMVVRSMEEKLSPLANGLQEIADGKLDVKLDEKNAGEYETIYRNFNAMAEELSRTKTEMDNFVNEFAHEFKTPITSIGGFADLLYETNGELDINEQKEYLKLISEQSHRLMNLSQNTLLLSKVEACVIITDKEKFSLSEQINRCAILFIKACEKKNITIDIPDDFSFSYYGNEELMEQIWINLIGNAVKFTPGNGTISIWQEITDKQLKIHIKDSGGGMSVETQKHIFDKYYQNDTTSIVKGNGIGLSIVKRITELCGGKVTVSSKLNEGSTFTVSLPLI